MGETSAEADEQQVAGPAGPTGPEPTGSGAPPSPEGPATEPATEEPVPEDPATGAVGRAALARARVLVPLYAVVAAALTWPLTLHLGSHLAYGSEPATTVPSFNLWTQRWNQHMVGSGLSGYWDAPRFHPATGTFALSEPQPLTGLVFAPISWVTGNPVLAFNVVALAVFVLNGLFGARLARHLGVGAAPAALTGVLAMGTPFVASQMGVLQLTVIFPLLALVDALVRCAPAGGGGRPVAGGDVPHLRLLRPVRAGRDPAARPAAGPARLVPPVAPGRGRPGAAVLRPRGACLILLAQQRLTADYERSEETTRALSARVGDFSELTGDALGRASCPGCATAATTSPSTRARPSTRCPTT